MHVTFRGINDAFKGLIQTIDNGSRGEGGCDTTKTSSRNGPVLKVVGPVIVTFTKPLERVLLNSARDQNPFFVLYEGLYMLAGRNDVSSLTYYASRMSDYSDDGKTLNGAYGYRWRNGSRFWVDTEPLDQIEILVEHLKKNFDSRRAVLQMWNVEDDLLKIGHPVDYSKDVCCNVCVMFSIRDAQGSQESFVPMSKILDMTVINRSNDLIWGLLGGDMIHFSLLQEYVAAHLGIEVGIYNQITNDLHVYLEGNSGWKPNEWLAEYASPETSTERWYTDDATKTVPLVQDTATFDQELPLIVEMYSGTVMGSSRASCRWQEPFFRDVASPMLFAFSLHRERQYETALLVVETVKADDWREAGQNWLLKRKQNWENRNAKVD